MRPARPSHNADDAPGAPARCTALPGEAQHPWLEYFWGILIRAYGEFEERVATLKGSKTGQIRAAVARRAGAFGIADIERDTPGVSATWSATCCGKCARKDA